MPLNKDDFIYITTRTRGARGVAECTFNGEAMTEEGRTIAHAVSLLCARLGKRKEAVGLPWRSITDRGLRGVIGQNTKRKRRQSVADMPSFELFGGQMRGRDE